MPFLSTWTQAPSWCSAGASVTRGSQFPQPMHFVLCMGSKITWLVLRALSLTTSGEALGCQQPPSAPSSNNPAAASAYTAAVGHQRNPLLLQSGDNKVPRDALTQSRRVLVSQGVNFHSQTYKSYYSLNTLWGEKINQQQNKKKK